MAKTILIFSDGTGQIGGLKPDQRLSNIYKMYRAMRPGPDSPIEPELQVAHYDAGLGAGETRGLTLSRLRNILSAGVGTGIDENVMDCYAAIISYYEPGDRICLFGFSRGAYTVRALANVLNLCGVPTKAADGGPVPRYGPPLRAIAEHAVRKVYNHGAGSIRATYEDEREKLAGRFRDLHGSNGLGADGEGQGNVQPHFVGVFDTVAALGSRTASIIVLGALALLLWFAIWVGGVAPLWLTLIASVPALYLAYRFLKAFLPIKFFSSDWALARRWWDPRRWISALEHSHIAWWSGKNYDRYVDREIPWLRHAQAIDEDRFKFPRVGWGNAADVTWNEKRGKKDWLVPMWFAGNHSDIGGSYPEEESRLSDIALQWMIDEIDAKLGPSITILRDRLVTAPNALGLQHSERTALLDIQPGWLRALTLNRLTWRKAVRQINPQAQLHDTSLDRLAASHVQQMGEIKPYRPESLRGHVDAKRYFVERGTAMATSDPRLERLYDYTKFHIGIYIVAAGAMVTIAGSTELSDFLDGLIKHTFLLIGAIVTMGIAGAAGGVIISSSAIAATFDEVWQQPIGPWGFKMMAGRRWATVEHASFWASILLFTAAALIPA